MSFTDKEVEEAERTLRIGRKCGLPERFLRLLENGAKMTPAMRKAIDWTVEGSRWCLVLAGPLGVGKSAASCLWLLSVRAPDPKKHNLVRIWPRIELRRREGEEQAYLPAWWAAADLARLGAFDGKFDAICDHPGPVVIDDVVSEYASKSGFFLDGFAAFIDRRSRNLLPTMLTTNLNATDFCEHYSERVIDRLRDGGTFFEMLGPNLREHDPVETEDVLVPKWMGNC